MTAPLHRTNTQPTLPDLGGVVARLHELRQHSHQSRYGLGAPPQLPSRTAVCEIIDDLTAALFPRHFGPQGLPSEGFDAFVAFALVRAHQALQEQVRRELELASPEDGRLIGEAPQATRIATEFLEDLPDIRALLETDIRAAYEGDPAATSMDEVMCCYPGVAALIRHRFAHGLYRLGAPMLARIVAEIAHSQTGIDIHPGAQIGESFFIDHGTGVVIGETTIIGRGVRLYQGVTLGARRFEVDEDGALAKNYPRHPIVEDDVVIYAGASILGRITIGHGSTIAGSVWLTRSVPAGSTTTQARARNEAFADGSGI